MRAYNFQILDQSWMGFKFCLITLQYVLILVKTILLFDILISELSDQSNIKAESIRCLLVDDDTALLEQAKFFLEEKREGIEIETTTSGPKALDLLDGDGYDAVISDYQMADMDGLAFLRVLRKEREDDIPFIMFTGKSREDVAIEALNLGADR